MLNGKYFINKGNYSNFDTKICCSCFILRESTDCMKACLIGMQNDLKKNMPNVKTEGNNVKLDLKPSDVTIFCPYVIEFFFLCTKFIIFFDHFRKVYEPVRTCIPKCPNDELRFSVETAFGPLNYICVENYDGKCS